LALSDSKRPPATKPAQDNDEGPAEQPQI
jgi:hypothetical protein